MAKQDMPLEVSVQGPLAGFLSLRLCLNYLLLHSLLYLELQGLLRQWSFSIQIGPVLLGQAVTSDGRGLGA